MPSRQELQRVGTFRDPVLAANRIIDFKRRRPVNRYQFVMNFDAHTVVLTCCTLYLWEFNLNGDNLKSGSRKALKKAVWMRNLMLPYSKVTWILSRRIWVTANWAMTFSAALVVRSMLARYS